MPDTPAARRAAGRRQALLATAGIAAVAVAGTVTMAAWAPVPPPTPPTVPSLGSSDAGDGTWTPSAASVGPATGADPDSIAGHASSS